MNADQFWAVIDASRAGFDPTRARGNQAEQLDRLRDALVALAPDDVAAFEHHFETHMNDADRWDLWGAAYLIEGGCSDDGFIDFRSWLISLGREVFEAALRDPESLVDVAGAPGMEGASFEEFAYVAQDVHLDLTGEEVPDSGYEPADEPAGEPWSPDGDDLQRRFPRLWARFGG